MSSAAMRGGTSSKIRSSCSTSCAAFSLDCGVRCWGPYRAPRPDASLRDDLDRLLALRFVRVLDGQDGLQSADRYLELVLVGLAGGEVLEHQPRPHHRSDPALVAVLAGPLDHFVGEAR